jgi:hypothetical protein
MLVEYLLAYLDYILHHLGRSIAAAKSPVHCSQHLLRRQSRRMILSNLVLYCSICCCYSVWWKERSNSTLGGLANFLFEIYCIASMSRVDVIRVSSGVIFSSTRRALSVNGTWLMIIADSAVRSSLSPSSSVGPSLARFLASAGNYCCGKFRQGVMVISSSEISTGSAATAGRLPRRLSLCGEVRNCSVLAELCTCELLDLEGEEVGACSADQQDRATFR